MGDVVPFQTKRPLWLDITILVFAAAVFVSLILLGNWQVHRLAWKLDLIEAVDTRAFGDPVAAPSGPVNADDHAYLRVATSGIFRHDLSRKVKAVTALGAGFWVMTPLDAGSQRVWINRGFVPQLMAREEWAEPEGLRTVAGLLRMTEPGGTLLERNNPAENRWYSRDVAALSAGASLTATEDYFIDADHALGPNAWPRGGLTVVSFRNPHLSYAITWYAMATLLLAGMAYVIWDRFRLKVRSARDRRCA
ncbi:MAG: SURF1 family protein [Pseudomonadota bacterium]